MLSSVALRERNPPFESRPSFNEMFIVIVAMDVGADIDIAIVVGGGLCVCMYVCMYVCVCWCVIAIES